MVGIRGTGRHSPGARIIPPLPFLDLSLLKRSKSLRRQRLAQQNFLDDFSGPLSRGRVRRAAITVELSLAMMFFGILFLDPQFSQHADLHGLMDCADAKGVPITLWIK
jgi:hypothetical protein